MLGTFTPSSRTVAPAPLTKWLPDTEIDSGVPARAGTPVRITADAVPMHRAAPAATVTRSRRAQPVVGPRSWAFISPV